MPRFPRLKTDRRPGPLRLVAGGLALAVLLAACSRGGPPPPCPAVVPVADAAQMVRFNGQGRDLTDVLFEAKIEDYGLTCEYDDDVIESQMLLKILAIRGPADRDRAANLKYFVAIATRDQEIGAREEFELAIPFEGNNSRVIAAEELTPRIPLRPGESGDNYLIYIGFVITPEELQYNRENR